MTKMIGGCLWDALTLMELTMKGGRIEAKKKIGEIYKEDGHAV